MPRTRSAPTIAPRAVAHTLTPTVARRLAITKQRLAGARPAPDAAGLLEVLRDIRCLQLDPTNVVARSHLLVLWSRLGAYDPAVLDGLLWQERCLFEYWAHCASIVLTEDYPIHAVRMRQAGQGDDVWGRRVQGWLAANAAFRAEVLALLAAGPRLAKDIPDHAAVDWPSSGWTAGRNVDRLLGFLWVAGEIMVAGRRGGQKLWALRDACLPADTPRAVLSPAEMVARAAPLALRALGVARPEDIQAHFVRGCYPGLAGVLDAAVQEGHIVPVAIAGPEGAWPGAWYVHTADLPLLEALAAGEWQPRTTLLSPFDNLICDRARTEHLFGFHFRIEIYVPAAARQYGYYVLPILHGDRLIGRISPRLDRRQGRLTVEAVYAEADAPLDAPTGAAVAAAIGDLAGFLGAQEIVYGAPLPAGWRPALSGARVAPAGAVLGCS